MSVAVKERQSAIGRRSRRKGAQFQKDVARMLSSAWGVPILSTPQSGGLSMKGDLCVGGNPPAYVLAYTIECKNRKDLSIPAILRNPDIVPISDTQIVFFKEYGSRDIWVAYNVHRGPMNLSPLGIAEPPPFLRISREDGQLLGVLKVDAAYLRERRASFVRRVNRPTKRGDEDPEG